MSNPGKFDSLDKEFTEIFEPRDAFEGVSIEWRRPVSMGKRGRDVLEIGHTFAFAGPPASYSLHAQLLRNGHRFMGRVSTTTGKVLGTYNKHLGSGFFIKLIAQIGAKRSVLGGEIIRKGLDYTTSIEYVSQGVLEMNYHQALSRSLSMGFKASSGKMIGSILMSGFRYSRPGWAFVGMHSTDGVASLGYLQGVGQRASWVTQLNFSTANAQGYLESDVGIGWSYNFSADSIVKASISTNGRLNCLITDQILPNLAISLCGNFDYSQDAYKVGVGAVIIV
eukprot:TRINITY_DN19792_c0_g1_i1.p1 TRINITY_DN19792_c0_g1~~TRINITY_DN19792_c0_g1_i1.p1  ORF type:complete len:280 (-),score=20.81 TRINITY_DN19792_c0_g1_i1:50-889(-)